MCSSPWARSPSGCDPRSPRAASATVQLVIVTQVDRTLRSSLTASGERHDVAHRPGRGAPIWLRSSLTASSERHPARPPAVLRRRVDGCDPRSPRAASATLLAQPGRSTWSCDPRSPRAASATSIDPGPSAAPGSVAILAHRERRAPPRSRGPVCPERIRLRSSLTASGERHRAALARVIPRQRVAILAHRERRAPRCSRRPAARCTTSCDPRSPRAASAA